MQSASEAQRIARLQKDREHAKEEAERQRAALEKETARDRTSNARFVGTSASIEETLKTETIGLHRLSDFQEKKRILAEQLAREAAQTDDLKNEEVKRKRKDAKRKKATLSFAGDDDDDDADGTNGNVARKKGKKETKNSEVKVMKFGKNPGVDTTFLPDREREEMERKLREDLRQEWLKKQEELKKEPLEITYSYFDGGGHRNQVEVKKGDTIAAFLDKARLQFPELRGVSADNLMYIKEDLIIPHHFTFYDFIVSKARGKSGPLFNFDVHDDVRLRHDATREKDESHAGKVVERSYYNKNKHIFPLSRWEAFQPDKDWGKYSIKS